MPSGVSVAHYFLLIVVVFFQGWFLFRTPTDYSIWADNTGSHMFGLSGLRGMRNCLVHRQHHGLVTNRRRFLICMGAPSALCAGERKASRSTASPLNPWADDHVGVSWCLVSDLSVLLCYMLYVICYITLGDGCTGTQKLPRFPSRYRDVLPKKDHLARLDERWRCLRLVYFYSGQIHCVDTL